MRLRPFKLERFFAEYEFKVRHLLCSSDAESMSIAELLAYEPGAAERLQSSRLGYSESMGAPELREAIAKLYRGITADDVLVFTGAEEAIFAFFNVALGAGDQLIAHAPAYQSLHEVAHAAGAQVTRWEATHERGWQLDPDDLPKLATPKAKVVLVNTPHNPSGVLLERDRFEATVRFAEQRGCWLFSDEVYRGVEHDSSKRLPSACELSARAVSMGVTSKAYGLPGLRVGWLVVRDPALRAELAAYKDYLTICGAGPSELLAAIAMRNAGAIAGRVRTLCMENLKLVDAFMATHAGRFEWVRPSAGTICFPRVREADSAPMCRQLLDDAGVLLAPGAMFDADPRHFRIGFGRRSLPEALAKFDEWLRRPAAS
ncbi:MAG: aminotransferase class I/II-fold pyridoxal phosphate-dependent enzyme [Myxococcaceae bacterium]